MNVPTPRTPGAPAPRPGVGAAARRLLALIAAAATVALPFTPRLYADEESPALAKYAKSVDEAVDRALAYLAAKQDADGVFASGMPRNTGITSLCVMAFLARGYTPSTPPYGDTVNRGVDAVLRSAKDSGLLVADPQAFGPMYSHAISTLMLSEVSGMVDPDRQQQLDAALGKALALILNAQRMPKSDREQGGWRYQADSRDSDISCTGWALMTLRSARNGGAAVPREAVDSAVRFVLNCRNQDGGFGYQPGGGSGLARTGTALLCLELSGHHRDETTVKAGEWILHNLPRPLEPEFYYYAVYYTAQGMFQLGGEAWEAFAEHLFRSALDQQQADGSWPDGRSQEAQAGPCYSTAMSVLALSVVYRQLPIYQR